MQKRGSKNARVGVLFNFGHGSSAHALAVAEVFKVAASSFRLCASLPSLSLDSYFFQSLK